MSPVNPRPVANLGVVLMWLGRFVEAEANPLSEALRRDPRDVVAAAKIGPVRRYAEDQRQGREVMDVHFHKINFLEARKWVKGWRLRLLTWVMQSVNRDPQGRSLGRRVLIWWLTCWFGPGRGGHGPTAGPAPATPGQGEHRSNPGRPSGPGDQRRGSRPGDRITSRAARVCSRLRVRDGKTGPGSESPRSISSRIAKVWSLVRPRSQRCTDLGQLGRERRRGCRASGRPRGTTARSASPPPGRRSARGSRPRRPPPRPAQGRGEPELVARPVAQLAPRQLAGRYHHQPETVQRPIIQGTQGQVGRPSPVGAMIGGQQARAVPG